MARAADMADESLRALITAAPRFWTHEMRSPFSQAWSSSDLSSSATGTPFTVACVQSGNCVAEWLPQMTACFTSSTDAPTRIASCECSRLWSRRVRAVMLPRGMVGAALSARMRAFVFAGLPTTTILQLGLPTLASALPCSVKMPPFLARRSLRSMPSLRGKAPTRMATSASTNASSGFDVTSVFPSSGARRSSSSSTTPCTASSAGATSSRRRLILT
mmetsp:Transcript_18337/g.47251  ORF Transcript_18337/g.47251 Transcript_18337/m.47251 type:complete len:218 (+) Transcript_18337:555-1208(+)